MEGKFKEQEKIREDETKEFQIKKRKSQENKSRGKNRKRFERRPDQTQKE